MIEELEEITIEVTDFCPFRCPYCSSNTVYRRTEATFIKLDTIRAILKGKWFNHIIISGGEPLAHPNFYDIHMLCDEHTDDVVVYSNLIRHRAFNPNVIDNVYLEASLTLAPEVKKLRILKRMIQGKEKTRPEVTFSRNWTQDCHCDHKVVRPDGTISETPCRKDVKHKIEQS